MIVWTKTEAAPITLEALFRSMTRIQWLRELPKQRNSRPALMSYLADLVRQLRLKCALKDLGPTRHILRMKISWLRDKRQLFFSSRLHQTCLGALQHAIGQVCFDPAPYSSSALSARLPDIRSGGGRYEVGTVCTGSRLPYVRDGRDTAWYFWHRRSHQQIYAQSRPIALERSQACVQISSWHKRPRHSFWSELNFRRSRLYQIELHRLCGQS